MSITSDRFCVYLRKDIDNDDLLKFINGQKSLSASIRLLIKAYMATAKTLDVESADLFDVINAVSAKSLGLLDPNIVASEKLADNNRLAKTSLNKSNNMSNERDDVSFDDSDNDDFDDGDDNIVDMDIKEALIQDDHGSDDTNTNNSSGSIDDFMGDF